MSGPTYQRTVAILGVIIILFACIALIAGIVFMWMQTFSPTLSGAPTLTFPTPQPLPGVTDAPAPATAISTSLPPEQNPAVPPGKIVYVCQLFRSSASDQICLMNPDGSNNRRLTTANNAKHYYPSLSPDGQSIVFTANLNGKTFEIYEMDINGENLRQLTDDIGIPNAPAISPDGTKIAFTRGDGVSKTDLWIMERNGENPRPLYSNGWDPAWSPDGSKLMFASVVQGSIQLMTIDADGSNPRVLTNLPNLRGRNDWSPDGQFIITYSGTPWNRELFIMNADGSGARQLTPTGGNSQGPSFSPYGEWVVFTAYFDLYGDDNGCEIYIIRTDGTDLRRLTDNNYCDWQPRWGR